ncbi:MAG: DsrE family protein [Firmicutes bacterium]|nr:DsrE family protein [Bacillota bacterium]
MKDKLIILWTSRDREVALNMVFMYALNGKLRGWWDDITLIVWGPSSKLLSVDIELQDNIKKMIDIGVKVKACKACSENYGVTKDLENMGINVKYMGEPLTEYIKKDAKILTF